METVVLLHCSGSSGAQWRSLGARLGDAYQPMAPDLVHPGTLEGEAAAIPFEEPVHLVGHSYGGAVALHLARTRPDLLKSLTLIEPSAFHLLEEGEALREIRAVAADARAALHACDDVGGYGRFVEYWTGVKGTRAAPQLSSVVMDFQALFRGPADVCAIDVPTLIIRGDSTKLPSREICNRLRAALPSAAFHLVPGAGHMSPITHRDQVNGLIHHFLMEETCNRAMPSASKSRSASAGRSIAT